MNDIVVAEPPQAPAPVDTPPPTLIKAILEVARDPKLDVAKLDALLKMQAELEERQAKRDFIQAFARLSAKLPRVKKEGVIDLGKGREIAFARFEDMDRVLRPLLAEEGFTLSFDSAPRDGGGLIVTTHLMHVSGHSRTAIIPLPLDSGPGRNNLQAVGSTLQYGKRYGMEMVVNLVREGVDDDGNKGGTAFLAPPQIEELQALIGDTGTDIAKYCAVVGVASLAEIPQASFAMAKNLLLQKRQKSNQGA